MLASKTWTVMTNHIFLFLDYSTPIWVNFSIFYVCCCVLQPILVSATCISIFEPVYQYSPCISVYTTVYNMYTARFSTLKFAICLITTVIPLPRPVRHLLYWQWGRPERKTNGFGPLWTISKCKDGKKSPIDSHSRLHPNKLRKKKSECIPCN